MFNGTRILIWSANPDKLVKFYQEVLELKLEEKTDIPAQKGLAADYGYMLIISSNGDKVWIGKHSEVRGVSKEPVRIMHNLYTDEVEYWYKRVKKAGCKILCQPTKTPFFSKDIPWYVATFLDPEGNAWQFMGKISNDD